MPDTTETTPARLRDIFTTFAADYEGQSEAVLRVSEEFRHPYLSLALAELANVLSMVSSAFAECAARGDARPMCELSEATLGALDWSNTATVEPAAPGDGDDATPDHYRTADAIHTDPEE